MVIGCGFGREILLNGTVVECLVDNMVRVSENDKIVVKDAGGWASRSSTVGACDEIHVNILWPGHGSKQRNGPRAVCAYNSRARL